MLLDHINKQKISLFIFLFINFIYSVKYLSRVSDYYIIISLLIVGCYWALWKCRNATKVYYSYLNNINTLLIILFIIGSSVVFKKIHVETLNVDRWSVITSFWDSFFKGEYVYLAKSNVGNPPGPMPFYFILALPFYLIGELGYFSVLGIVFFFILLKKTKISLYLQTTGLLLVLLSFFHLYEVACRSNILLNGTLVLMVLVFFLHLKNINTKNIFISGILIGLIISTRNVFVIPFIIGFIYSLKSNKISFKQTFLLGVIAIIFFGLTFVPFVWNHFEAFKIINPFIVQSTFLIPFKYTLAFVGLSIIAGFLCKTKDDVYFFSGLVLFLSIIIYYVYHFIIEGFYETFFNSVADIAYFILCIPFVIFYFLNQEEKKQQ